MRDYTQHIKAAIRDKVADMNNGSNIHGLHIPDYVFALNDAHLRVGHDDRDWYVMRYDDWRDKFLDGEIIAKFPRRLSTKKRNLCYAELMPFVPKIRA